MPGREKIKNEKNSRVIHFFGINGQSVDVAVNGFGPGG
jgi:hypothetical protein